MPVKHFIAACNANDVVTQYLQTEKYTPKPAVATISNAMDVGNPSNFVRIIELFHQQFSTLKKHMSSISVDDITTAQTIKEVYQQQQYTLDPHGAVAYFALDDYLQKNGGKGFILETAHPVKFPDTVEDATGRSIEFPEQVQHLLSAEKKSILMMSHFSDFKEWLMNR